MPEVTGCVVCGGSVEFSQFTDLCNACDDAYLKWANGDSNDL